MVCRRQGLLSVAIGLCSCVVRPTPSPSDKQASAQTQDPTSRWISLKAEASLYPDHIRNRPLQNHLELDPEYFQYSQSKDPRSLVPYADLVRVISFNPSRCKIKASRLRAAQSWETHSKRSVIVPSKIDQHWSGPEQTALLNDALAKDSKLDLLVSDLYLFDLQAFGISSLRHAAISFNQHSLAAESSARSTLFWRAEAPVLCLAKAPEQDATFAAIKLPQAKLALLVSQARDLGDYWNALRDWTYRGFQWPLHCYPKARKNPGVPLDWPASSPRIAFGSILDPVIERELDPSRLGLSCKGKIDVHRRRGLLGGLRPVTAKAPEIPDPNLLVARDDSIPLESFGLQNKAPYVWALVDLESRKVRAMGNLVK